ncbi:hypothetical protein [Vandammella animalimorsus]|uniref:Uncharacterized protein n=1 Tax=Vandammella animalimorsus TaxID=2029117 RepID=A0A2A2A8Q1_9BURK|nr:hypothetical protein [Vandammella animalimorsus]PAT34104.1 hypothetical protein CK620_10680 [Vandammella animalimorsus]
MNKRLLLLAWLAGCAWPGLAAWDLPAGWSRQAQQQGVVSYSPAGLGERIFMVVALDPLPMQGQTPQQWTQAMAEQLSQGYGKIAAREALQHKAPLWSTTHRIDAQGRALVATYTALPLDDGRARLVFLVSEQSETLLAQHGQQGAQVLAAALAEGQPSSQGGAASLAAPPASPVEPASPTKPERTPEHTRERSYAGLAADGATIGGAFTFGQYRCQVENGRHPYEVTLELYPNKELRSSMSRLKTGRFSYHPDKGTVNIDEKIHLLNFEYRGQVQMVSVYFKDRQGRAYIRGEDLDEGEGTTCRHVGPSASPSPSEEAAAQAEERRFKWVTPPGQGVQPGQIEAILHSAEFVNDSLGMRLEEEHLLLLKDGWAYAGLRVPPADLDVRASRANEPGKWRRWRKQRGQYQLEKVDTWEDAPGTPARPARADQRLHGAYTASSYHGNIYTSGYAFKDTLYFKRDGTLGSSSSMRGGTTAMNSGTFSANVASDRSDERPVQYRLDGYTLERRYPDGQSTRSLFFFWGEGEQHITINGTTYSQ